MTGSLIETVARLKELEGRWRQAIKETAKPNHALLERLEIERDMIASLPELLDVLGEVRAGDDKLISLIILNNQQRWTDQNWKNAIDCLRRYQALAAKMEETE